MLKRVNSELTEHGPTSFSMVDKFSEMHDSLKLVGARVDTRLMDHVKKDREILQNQYVMKGYNHDDSYD